ncbi:MAG TPA: hypothetical protein VF399_05760 [bacterium]|jgi:hypothetical protein
MKKALIGLVAAIALVGAVDLDGRIGMGLGFSPDTYLESGLTTLGFPVIDLAVTKFGFSPKMAVEPIFQFTMVNANDNTSIRFRLDALLDILMKGHSKTNVYAKAGLGFMFYSTGAPGADAEFGLSVPFGFGLEHFCSEHFSINLAAISGLTFISNPPAGGDSYLNFKLGNEKPFAFYLLWYY